VGNPTHPPALLWSRRLRGSNLRTGFVSAFLLLGFVSQSAALPGFKGEHWDELNIGPFYVYSKSGQSAAREDLTQLEQVRWVLGGLLESKDLPSLWPIRIFLAKDEKTNPSGQFVWKNGSYLLILKSGAQVPLDQVAGLLLDANTPRLPDQAESGLRQLFGTLEAHGSRVTWGGPVPQPDLAWARMQLFATKFEYGSSFHVFVTSLKNGSSLRVAEQNSFGKNPDELEKEAAANLAAGNWQATSVSGRPLDPKRDFGEHSVPESLVDTYFADATLSSDPKGAEAAYKSGVEAGGESMARGYEGLAGLARRDKENPDRYLQDAIRAGSDSAPVYVSAAQGKPESEALPLLKRAAELNPLWAEPVYQQAQLAADPAAKEALLKKASQLEPRQTKYWIELAQLQTTDGHALAAQGSWLRAEDSASSDAERSRIHDLHAANERERLDAAEAERRREREAVHLDDQRAQDAEMDRIRATEEKANKQLDASAGGGKPTSVVPWEDTVPKKTIAARLTRVDCLKGTYRLWLTDKAGRTLELQLDDPQSSGLACGPQQPSRRVSVTYAAQADDRLQTAGRILSLKFQ
jgi:hypothetical protein